MISLIDISELYLIFRGLMILFIVSVSSIYLIGALYGIYVNFKYKHRHHLTDYKAVGKSPYAPGISLIAPAYNESMTIIDNVRSMIGLEYPKLQVIVVNDGSIDDSMEKLINYFDLFKIQDFSEGEIVTKPVRGVYRSANGAYGRLVVIDKENGGKSDALNAGINFSQYPIIGCMDVDSILLSDSLQKLIKPFLDDPTVIATGGAVRIANSCRIVHGHLKEVKLPNRILERFQVLEYLRSFLIGRMAWSGINGLLLVSGAVGLFKKSIVLEVGGYNTDVVGEDLELIIRMRRHLYDYHRKHRIVYVPDPVCWTEAPSDTRVLARQRNRWNRGALEALLIHKRMIFNPKYGMVGMVSLPYWLFFEWMSPIIEAVGLCLTGIMVILGLFNFTEFLLATLLITCFVVLISTFTMFIEEITFQRYTRKSEVFKLFHVAWLEPIIYHPLILVWSLSGTWDKISGRTRGWGQMTRKGFSSKGQIS